MNPRVEAAFYKTLSRLFDPGRILVNLNYSFEQQVQRLVGEDRVNDVETASSLLRAKHDLLARYELLREKVPPQQRAELTEHLEDIIADVFLYKLSPIAFQVIPWVTAGFKSFGRPTVKSENGGVYTYLMEETLVDNPDPRRHPIGALQEIIGYHGHYGVEHTDDPIYSVNSIILPHGLYPQDTEEYLEVVAVSDDPHYMKTQVRYFPNGQVIAQGIGDISEEDCGVPKIEGVKQRLRGMGYPEIGDVPEKIDYPDARQRFLDFAISVDFSHPPFPLIPTS